MAPDYRSDKSETHRGQGHRWSAWDAYGKRVNVVAIPLASAGDSPHRGHPDGGPVGLLVAVAPLRRLRGARASSA